MSCDWNNGVLSLPPPGPFEWGRGKLSLANTTWIDESEVIIDYSAPSNLVTQVMGPVNLKSKFDKVYLEFSIESTGAAFDPNILRLRDTYVGVAPYPIDNNFVRSGVDRTNLTTTFNTSIATASNYSGFPTDPVDDNSVQHYSYSIVSDGSINWTHFPPGASASFGSTGGVPIRGDGDILMLAMDLVEGRCWFGVNGVWDVTVLGGGLVGNDPSDYSSSNFAAAGDLNGFGFPYGAFSSRGNKSLNDAFFPSLTFYPDASGTESASVKIYGNELRPFNYSVPAGYNVEI
jgi:hypothetical protein